MISTQEEKESLSLASLAPLEQAGNQTLTYWPALSVNEKAIVAAYIENSYSVKETAAALRCGSGEISRMLKQPAVRRAIAEVQKELDGIDFLNERWVKAQLLRLYPMVIGDEPVPTVLNTGEEVEVRKFYPDIAMRVIEYVAPKAQKASVNISINNINKLTDEQLEEIACRGMRVVSEQ
jgi:hypothetical protein